MAPLLHDAYVSVKRAEIEACAGLETDAICERYADIY